MLPDRRSPGPEAAMKAILDHIGIAVQDIEKALAFYREALGLEVQPPEEVVTERVRARAVPVGGPSLELLEATAPDSAIATYIGKRGPGLHHVTLARRRHSRGAGTSQRSRRAPDQQRAAARRGRVARRVHSPVRGPWRPGRTEAARRTGPQARGQDTARSVISQLTVLHDGPFRLDGGAMFGVVPRPLWEKLTPPDERNRIQLAMRPLLVEASWGRMLIDCGAGDKMGAEASGHLRARSQPRARSCARRRAA